MKVTSLLLLWRLFEVSDGMFWMLVELTNMDVSSSCLDRSSCVDTRFQITESILSLNEKKSVSWPVHSVDQNSQKILMSEWTIGDSEDVTLVCRIVGSDPVYGFPRVCDETPTKLAFETMSHLERGFVIGNDSNRAVLQLRGKCFNVTMHIQRFLDRCPWCPPPTEPPSPSARVAGTSSSNTVILVLVVISVIALLCSVGLGCILMRVMKHNSFNEPLHNEPTHDQNNTNSFVFSPPRLNGSSRSYRTHATDSGVETASPNTSQASSLHFIKTVVLRDDTYDYISPNSSIAHSREESVSSFNV